MMIIIIIIIIIRQKDVLLLAWNETRRRQFARTFDPEKKKTTQESIQDENGAYEKIDEKTFEKGLAVVGFIR